MNKKNILIAILCATIMLLVPLTNVSGASVGGLNIKVQVIEEADPVIPDYLIEEFLEELYDKINQVLTEYGFIPEIFDICNEILEKSNSINLMEDYPVICDMLNYLILIFTVLMGLLILLALELWQYSPVLALMIGALCIPLFSIIGVIFGLGEDIFDCEWWIFKTQIFKNETGLNLQISPDSISEYDLTTIIEIIQSFGLNDCPQYARFEGVII